MVLEMKSKPVSVFRIFDREGQPIGRVVQPKAEPVIGVGAKTVLLIRKLNLTGDCGLETGDSSSTSPPILAPGRLGAPTGGRSR
jgi:hypothetical protein